MDHFSFPHTASVSASGLRSFPNEPQKLRSACNRCHSQKLKCVKKEGEVSCQRCSRLKTACYFGTHASRTLIRASKRTTENVPAYSAALLPASEYEQTPTVHSGSVTENMTGNMIEDDWLLSWNTKTTATEQHDMSFPIYDSYASLETWTSPLNAWELEEPNESRFNYTILGGPMKSSSSNLSWSGPTYTASTKKNSSELENLEVNPVSLVRQLANLTVSLSELADQLPSVSKSVRPVGVAGKCRNDNRPKKPTLLIFDEFFRLTKEFTALVESTCNTEEHAVIDLPFSMQTEFDSSVPQADQWTRASTEDEPPNFSLVDEATILSMASCHCHLIEIYTSIFEMMQMCIAHSLVPQIGEDWAVILPRLQVGDHVTSPPVRVDLSTPISSKQKIGTYMLMITLLSSQLWEQLTDAMQIVRLRVSRGSLSDLVWDGATNKNVYMMATIAATKTTVNEFSMAV